MQCNVLTVLIYFATKIQANLSNNMENHHMNFNRMCWLVMKKSWFYWKTYWVCDTYQLFSIPTDPDNFPVFQPILMKSYRVGPYKISFQAVFRKMEYQVSCTAGRQGIQLRSVISIFLQIWLRYLYECFLRGFLITKTIITKIHVKIFQNE